MINRRVLGDSIEKECVLYLQSNNVTVLQKNYFCRVGEIDIIGKEKVKDYENPGQFVDSLVFFEVKYRKNDHAGSAELAVGMSKQKNICRVAKHYMFENKIPADTPVRFDVLAVNGQVISWYKNAFEFIR